jgi:hypothetical protein
MATTPPKLKELSFGRRASLRIRLTTSMVFRAEGLAGACDTSAGKLDAILQNLHCASTKARTMAQPPLGNAVRQAVGDFGDFTFSPQDPTDRLLKHRVDCYRERIAAFECAHCSGSDLEERICIAEFAELFDSTKSFVLERYRQAAQGREPAAWPALLLETTYNHAHQTTDILDIAAATGSCRVADGDSPISIVGIAITDDAFCWTTLCQLPYGMMHELVCHAFQGLKASKRTVVDKTCAWTEGWMDALAFEVTKEWLAGSNNVAWVCDARDAVLEAGSRLHGRRREQQGTIMPQVLRRRIAAHGAVADLKRSLCGQDPNPIDALHRVMQFSFCLNLHEIPQDKRDDIANWIALGLEMFEGVQLDDLISTITRFMQHDNWHALYKDLDSLMK